ncbi:MAG: glycosyltransferase family 2 protein [bacterium]
MIENKKIAIVLPAYNCSATINKTVADIPYDIVDYLILVDDYSPDDTVKIAQSVGIDYVIKHEKNLGYGANQKTCYNKALEINADIIIMLHPDYQYTPKLIHSMAYIIANGIFPVVFASRILGGQAIKGGMPLYKYIFNRILTLFQNTILNAKLSEYHTGFRAFSREVLESIAFNNNSNDFIFDNQIILQLYNEKYSICEITCPVKYDKDSSSISLKKSIIYGFGVVSSTLKYILHKLRIIRYKILISNQ